MLPQPGRSCLAPPHSLPVMHHLVSDQAASCNSSLTFSFSCGPKKQNPSWVYQRRSICRSRYYLSECTTISSICQAGGKRTTLWVNNSTLMSPFTFLVQLLLSAKRAQSSLWRTQHLVSEQTNTCSMPTFCLASVPAQPSGRPSRPVQTIKSYDEAGVYNSIIITGIDVLMDSARPPWCEYGRCLNQTQHWWRWWL